MVRDWFAANNIVAKQLDVFSGDVHLRRSYELYSSAFDSNLELGILAAKPDRFILDSWWRSSDGAKTVISEFAGWLWVKCCFDPGDKGSHQEKWGTLKPINEGY